jgi:hypothetical protein
VNVITGIVSSSNLWRQLLVLAHMVTVFSGLIILGWLMNGFNAPTFVCVGTVLVCCYLVWVGSGGIALASVWVVALMSVAAINQLWLHDLPRPRFIYIPMLSLANWLLALMIVWRLGKISDFFQQSRASMGLIFFGLISLAAAGLRVGWQSYPKTLLYLTSVLQ